MIATPPNNIKPIEVLIGKPMKNNMPVAAIVTTPAPAIRGNTLFVRLSNCCAQCFARPLRNPSASYPPSAKALAWRDLSADSICLSKGLSAILTISVETATTVMPAKRTGLATNSVANKENMAPTLPMPNKAANSVTALIPITITRFLIVGLASSTPILAPKSFSIFCEKVTA